MERKLAAEAGRPAPRFTPASTPAVTVPGVGAGAGAGSGGGPSGSLAGVVGGVGLDGMTLDMKTMCVCGLLDEGRWCAWEVCVCGSPPNWLLGRTTAFCLCLVSLVLDMAWRDVVQRKSPFVPLFAFFFPCVHTHAQAHAHG